MSEPSRNGKAGGTQERRILLWLCPTPTYALWAKEASLQRSSDRSIADVLSDKGAKHRGVAERSRPHLRSCLISLSLLFLFASTKIHRSAGPPLRGPRPSAQRVVLNALATRLMYLRRSTLPARCSHKRSASTSLLVPSPQRRSHLSTLLSFAARLTGPKASPTAPLPV
ncbi:hypothetical protein B0J12DRAFT_267263 [Macrophomina phaseolina]|uniref:Uncharacterized protein n=1 Tax=Macrophomina phaseolina TaxID=35725 RepID=A0ABQ8FZ85_9PEZI|nr:hypothetical protein B0J12DRAFT_267263 [Macrophomina phaseolina]